MRAPYTGLRAVGRRHPGARGQDALGSERYRRFPVARWHRVLHRAVLPGAGEVEPAAGHAKTRHPGRVGARAGQHSGEDPWSGYTRLPRRS